MEFDELSNSVIGHAIEVHRQLGPRLLESAYKQCLAHELNHTESNSNSSIRNRCNTKTSGSIVDTKLTFSLKANSIVELSCVDEIKGIHQVQLLTYMNLSGTKIGLLINFNVAKLKGPHQTVVL
ncbi:MAG: GxxExxY protein [Planctomycetales bacterium]|nr:GxxExxY protein [Planctomycetales bacterium]